MVLNFAGMLSLCQGLNFFGSKFWASYYFSGRRRKTKNILIPESVCERFFVKKHLQNYTSSTSSHLHLCTITLSPLSLLIFTSAHPHIYISAHLHLHTSTSLLIFTSSHLHLTSSHLHLTSLPLIYISHLHLSLFLTFSLKAGGSAAGPPQNATLCGDRARRVRETQARVRFVSAAGNPLRRSCASSARNAGESAIWICPAQPSAEIVHVECAKCRRECDLRLSGATLCGDRSCRVREMQARVRFDPVAGNPLRKSCVSSVRNAGESAI